MSEEKYIAAIEISSSKIIAAVGRAYGEGQLDVIAVEQENATDSVRYGMIQNLEDTSVRIARIIHRLEQRTGVSPRQIKGMFVGLSGRSLRNITTEVSRSLREDTEITDAILADLRNDAMRAAIDNTLEIIDVIPRGFKVGKAETRSPRGAIGNSIQATYDLIVCRPELKRNLKRTIEDKLGIRCEGFVVTAIATGHLILSDDVKNLGCMLVDMGAETTTVTIYKNKSLRYLATLPFGGRNITRDITSLNLLEENAEDIKKTSGNAIARELASSLNLNGVKLSDISNLVVARSEEIVANIVEQIEYAGLKENDIPGGIFVIGGGARLQGMIELLSQQSNLPVRRGALPPYVHLDEIKATSYECDQVVSVMYEGSTCGAKFSCLEEPEPQELPSSGYRPQEKEPEPEQKPVKPKKDRSKWIRSLGGRITSMFGNPEDDSEIID